LVAFGSLQWKMENGKVAVAAAAATIISRQAASKVILIKTYGNVCE